MASQHQFLERHGTAWRVQVAVPVSLRPIIGKRKLIHPLATESLAEANRLKWPHVTRFKAMLANAAQRAPTTIRDPLHHEALRWRDEVFADRLVAPEAAPAPSTSFELPLTADEVEYFDSQGLVDHSESVSDQLAIRAHEIEARLGPQRAGAFHRLASGKATPLAELLESCLAESELSGRSKSVYRLAVQALESWCQKERIEPTVEAISRRVAGRFVSEHLRSGRANHTVNKYISASSRYWQWMRKRGAVDVNPWSEQSLPKVKAHRRAGGKRPFADDEVAMLLAGPAKPYLRDIMTIAALSGMRIEEICSLQVKDCADGQFNITRSKTAAGRRKVPIHSALQSIISRRCDGYPPSAWLFRELPAMAPSRAEDNRRSDPVSKAFAHYRQKVGVHEVPVGAKQSNVDFHSFRRWFIDSAHKALVRGRVGFTPWTVAEVVGHDREAMALGMTFGHYAGPSPADAKRACVESASFPVAAASRQR